MKKKEKYQNNQKNSRSILVILFAIFLLSFLGWIFYESQRVNSSLEPNSGQVDQEREYSSEKLSFHIKIPFQHQIKEEGNQSTISVNENDIFIRRSATNFEDLEGYLTDLDLRNNSEAENEEFLIIDGHDAVKRTILLGTVESLNYKIFINGYVYALSTSSPELYDELDAIAQSFQYLGD